MKDDDLFVLSPEVWYAVLCDAFGIDPETGKVGMQGILNQIMFFEPPEGSGIASHAHLSSILAIALSGGEGHFRAHIDVRDMDNNVLWERPQGDWEFQVGLGSAPSAVFAQEISVWLPNAGRYHVAVTVRPGQLQFRIPFEVARRIGPAAAALPPEPGA